MQDRFVGDVGDFGKYGLLRALTGIHPALPEVDRLSLGVVWYRNGARGALGDGKHTAYLKKTNQFQCCDPVLFDALKGLVNRKQRTLYALEQTGVLGDATFYGHTVPRNADDRKHWVNEALDSGDGRDIVFFDPDKGLAPPSAKNSTEHIYLCEFTPSIKAEQTVVIYHQLGRTGLIKGRNCHALQMRDWAKRLKEDLTLPDFPRVLWYRRGTARAFFILSARQHSAVIDACLARMLDGPWACHFTQLML